jgi:hypothetical protein
VGNIHQSDIIGQKFGHWLVVSNAAPDKHYNAYYWCVCDCGTERTVLRSALLQGKSSSCGCLQAELNLARLKEEFTGHMFGRLHVLDVTNNQKYPVAYCQCSCGELVTVRCANLRNGITRSCGCLARELASARKRLMPGKAAMRTLLFSYKYHATQRNLEFDLTESQFCELTSQVCYYCGIPPLTIQKPSSGVGGVYVYNGIDRVDSRSGYSLGNCVPCCKRCNTAKSDMSVHNFLDLVRRIYSLHIGK